MSRRKKDPLRLLTPEERGFLERLCRARSSAPADQIARAVGILAVTQGKSYGEAAQLCNRRQGTTVAAWVSRFNQEGLAALAPEHGGGHAPRFTGQVKEKILATFKRPAVLETDGTAAWYGSLVGLDLAKGAGAGGHRHQWLQPVGAAAGGRLHLPERPLLVPHRRGQAQAAEE